MTARALIVVPSVGRPALARLLAALGDRVPEPVLVVDDRPERDRPLPGVGAAGSPRVRVVSGPASGPAAARNAGWRTAAGMGADWVAFLDDDVLPEPGWAAALAEDLATAPPDVGGIQGRVRVPLPAHRRPTDWERGVAGLADARWITADMAYRATALAAVGGFDERFPRAYREDADIALRVREAGWRLTVGRRRVAHPVGPAPRLASLRRQAGNRDDALMAAIHGPGWRDRAGAPPGRLARHLVTAAAAAAALGLLAAGRPTAAAAAAGAWLAGTAEFAAARITPGPRNPAEVGEMILTSAVIPVAATAHAAAGRALAVRHRGRPWRTPAPPPRPPAAVLLDRDGTLVLDVPYNGDPDRVVPMPGARRAIAMLRAAGVPTAVVSNQSGVARGLLAREDVHAVNRRIERELGALGPWIICPHGPGDGCACRKPRPGMVLEAARRLGVDPADCALVGDIGADVHAALAAGARPILVPTPRTRRAEVRAAPEVAPTLVEAVARLLAGRPA